MTNLARQAVDYRGWHDAGTFCPLKDSLNFYYNMIKFASSQLPEGCVRRKRMGPHESISDVVVFESPGPVSLSNRLQLDLPVGRAMFLFEIPGTIIRRPPPNLVVLMSPPPPVTAQPPPPPKLTVEDQIRAESLEKWRDVVKKARMMSSKKAEEHGRRMKQQIIDDLCKEFGMSRGELKSIVPQAFRP